MNGIYEQCSLLSVSDLVFSSFFLFSFFLATNFRSVIVKIKAMVEKGKVIIFFCSFAAMEIDRMAMPHRIEYVKLMHRKLSPND